MIPEKTTKKNPKSENVNKVKERQHIANSNETASPGNTRDNTKQLLLCAVLVLGYRVV